MKKKMFSFFAVMGMAIAIGTAAFTAKAIDLNSNEDLIWVFEGTSPAEHENPALYSVGQPSDKCEGASDLRCTITAPMTGASQPDLNNISEETFKL